MIKQPQDFAALIFDCDGTLTDSMEVHYVAWKQTMSQHNIDFNRDRFYALGGVPTDKIIALLADEATIKLDVPQVAIEKEEAFMQLLSTVRPFDPVWQIAKQFRHVKPMAVASGGLRPSIVAQLHQIGCGDWFDAIVTAEDTKRHKPDPDVFLLAANLMNKTPSDCLVYEDSDLGIDAAKAAGMSFVDVREFR